RMNRRTHSTYRSAGSGRAKGASAASRRRASSLGGWWAGAGQPGQQTSGDLRWEEVTGGRVYTKPAVRGTRIDTRTDRPLDTVVGARMRWPVLPRAAVLPRARAS